MNDTQRPPREQDDSNPWDDVHDQIKALAGLESVFKVVMDEYHDLLGTGRQFSARQDLVDEFEYIHEQLRRHVVDLEAAYERLFKAADPDQDRPQSAGAPAASA